MHILHVGQTPEVLFDLRFELHADPTRVENPGDDPRAVLDLPLDPG